jgi:hypothetical protein
MEWAACRDARLGMGARGVEYAAGDAWYGGMGDRGDTVGDGGAWRGICGRGCMVCRGARPCAPTPCHHAWGVPPCHHAWGVSPCHHAWGVSPCDHARGVPPCDHAWGVSPCAPNNRHQPIHRPDHRCPNAFTEPMTPIRRGARPCAPTIAGAGCWVAECMGARPCAPTIAGVGYWVAECMGAPPCHHAWGAPPCHHAWGAPPCAPTCLPPTESRRG